MNMEINWRQIFFLPSLFMLVVFSNAGAAKERALPKVVILADDSYPPYSYVENKQLKGIYVDIVNAAAQLMSEHYQVNLLGMPWKRALMKVEKGEVLAILPPYKHIEEREYIWPYSLAIMSETVVAYCQNNINIIDYFDGKFSAPLSVLNIGINSGYMIFSDDIKAAVADKRMMVWENKSTEANIMKLQSKRLDCYLNDRLAIQYELLMLTNTLRLNFDDVAEALIVMSQTAHIGYSNSDNQKYSYKNDFINRMDDALQQVKNSPQYSEIIEKYIQPL